MQKKVREYCQCTPCNFDVDKCGFVDEDNDNFDWSRQNGGTSSLDTGPPNDHTTGTSQGYYMYVETSGTNLRIGDVAILRSPRYNTSSSACSACMLEFWYHMYGSAIGKLEVFLEETDDHLPLSRTPIWSLSGDQGNRWQKATVPTLTIASETFYLIFLATYNGLWTGDIAIDDIALKECTSTPTPSTPTPTLALPTCSADQWLCPDGSSCIQRTQLCDGNSDCTEGADESSPVPCMSECSPSYCVNKGQCFIEAGQQKCRCSHPFYGPRCEKTDFGTRKPKTPTSVTCTPTCNPDANSSCWCLGNPLYRRHHFCQACTPTGECNECVCNHILQCFPTSDFVRREMAESTSTTRVIVNPGGGNQQTGSGTDSGLSSGAYAAIAVSIIVLGVIVVAVIIYFIMSKKYYSKLGSSNRLAAGPHSPMTADTASGIGNPVYKMFGSPEGGTRITGDIDDVDMSDIFSPSEATLPKPAHHSSLGKDARGNPLYRDPYSKLENK
ncbi:MAM and LDL-receptor class A domain-containing protein 2-like [Corticium candelabrum]|uniref:MAM and LDL-receptor class A domain-containing protein 2-like n=1 Tax=Corticium candelabrum TaxID=121492 RepID=UPI002E266182|nr:MAM and LDL-receptor class A domain-containing protein 2-like [Corticium candelabrum]